VSSAAKKRDTTEAIRHIPFPHPDSYRDADFNTADERRSFTRQLRIPRKSAGVKISVNLREPVRAKAFVPRHTKKDCPKTANHRTDNWVLFI
jgi:hypothetical protein